MSDPSKPSHHALARLRPVRVEHVRGPVIMTSYNEDGTTRGTITLAGPARFTYRDELDLSPESDREHIERLALRPRRPGGSRR